MATDHEVGAGFQNWAPILGRWTLRSDEAIYAGVKDENAYGLLRAPDSVGVSGGSVACTMMFPPSPGDEPEPQGRIVFGFNPRTQQHYSAGLGGFRALYTVEQYIPDRGFSPLFATGRPDALRRERPLRVAVYLGGQAVLLDVDDVVVAEVQLPSPIESHYVGLVARGRGQVHFSNVVAAGQARRAFIVMQFGEPFDTLYDQVISPVCIELGFEPIRADEFTGPGLIIRDILRSYSGRRCGNC